VAAPDVRAQPLSLGARRILLTLAAILALKLTLLAISAPIMTPDSGGYLGYSNMMLSSSAWLHDAGVTSTAISEPALRMVGYPLLMSGARLLAGGEWGWLLAILQIAFAVSVLLRLCALQRPLGLSPGAMLFVVVAIATSSSLVLDNTMLTDSAHASLITLAITALLLPALSGRPLGAWAALGVGLLLVIAFLLREALVYLWLPMLPLLALAIGTKRRFAVAALVLLPLAAAIVGYSAWNKQRAGTAFVTTGAQTALLHPIVVASGYDPGIFAGETPLDEAARQTVNAHDFTDVIYMNLRLFSEFHMTGPQISAAVYRKYFASWRGHPLAMARTVLANLRPNQAFLLFRPIDALREYILWATGRPSELGRRKSVAADWHMLPLFVLSQLCRVASTVLFAAFLFGSPWRAWRDGRRSAAARAGLAVWLLYLGWYAIYAVVHVETRYMAPVLPFAVLFGVANLLWLWRRGTEGGGAFSGDTA
jgi:hypothetical protein